MKISNRLILASAVCALAPSMAWAENCDSYRQQAQEKRQLAAQYSAQAHGGNQQAGTIQGAAQAYQNAAAQFDAKYHECVSGRGGGGGTGNASPGYGGGGSNDAMQNFYNQMNQYQNQQADQQRRQADREETGRLREEQGENRAESERLRQLQNAEMQQTIEQLDAQTQGNLAANTRVREKVLGRKLTAKEWADMFAKKSQRAGAPSGNQGQARQGTERTPVDPNACTELVFAGKGQPDDKCRGTVKDALNTKIPTELEFAPQAQRLTPTDWSKRFGAPPASSKATAPAPRPTSVPPLAGTNEGGKRNSEWPYSVLSDQEVAPSAPSASLSSPSRAGVRDTTPEDDTAENTATGQRSRADKLSSDIKGIKEKAGSLTDKVRQTFSLKGLCQRARASVRYSKPYADLAALEQRDIDVECAALQIQNNTSAKGRYEYGSDVVDSGGKLLDEGAKQITKPSEP